MKRILFSIAAVVCVLGGIAALGQLSGPMRIDDRPNRLPVYLVVASDAPGTLRRSGPNVWICTGTADDAVIQAAMDRCADGGGGIVELSAGTFSIRDSLLFPDTDQSATPWGLVGQGISATILQKAANTYGPIIMPATTGCARKLNCLREMTLDGNKANVGASDTFTNTDVDATNDEITLTGHSFADGDEVFFVQASGGTLPAGLNATSRFYISDTDSDDDCKFYTSRAAAEAGGATGLVDITDQGSAHTHSVGRHTNDAVIHFNRTQSDTCNVLVKNGYDYGWYLACYKGEFRRCYAAHCDGIGFWVTGVGGYTFQSCMSTGNKKDGWKIGTYSEPAALYDCIAAYNGCRTNRTSSGFDIISGDKVRLIGCRAYGNADSGIHVAGGTDNCLIAYCQTRANYMGTVESAPDITIEGNNTTIIGCFLNGDPYEDSSVNNVLNGVSITDVKDDLLPADVSFTDDDDANATNVCGALVRVAPAGNVADWTKLSLTITYRTPVVESSALYHTFLGGSYSQTLTWESSATAQYLEYPAMAITAVVVAEKDLGAQPDSGTLNIGTYQNPPAQPIDFEGAAVGATIIGNTFTGHTSLYPGTMTNLSGVRRISGNTPERPCDTTQTLYVKNTSGGSLAQGDVVVLSNDSTNTAGDEVETTTTAGDHRVIGMVDETIADDAYGYVLILGHTTHLKADGTDDIAVGDSLSAFTTVKIAQKAASGECVFAIALEAYTTDDSNGVIDALLIPPRIAE